MPDDLAPLKDDWNSMSPRQKAIGLLLGAAIFIGGWFLISWVQRPREDTGEATFHPTAGYAANKGETVHITLPAGWKARYNGHQPFREATLFDQNGNGQFELTVDIRSGAGGPPIAAALNKFEAAERSNPGVKLISASRNDTTHGTVSWCIVQSQQATGGRIFIMDENSPRNAATMQFVGGATWKSDLVVFRFHLLEQRRDELQPVAWKIFQEAQFS